MLYMFLADSEEYEIDEISYEELNDLIDDAENERFEIPQL